MKQNIYAWSALAVRSFGTLFLLIIASNNYSEREMAIWLVLQVLASMQAVFDFGVSPTVLRFSIYSLQRDAGPPLELNEIERTRLKKLRAIPFRRFQTYVRTLYLLIAATAFLTTLLLGSFALSGLIEAPDGEASALALLILSALGNAAAIYQLNYTTYLNARKQVTLLKKTEALIGVATLLIPLFLILMDVDLLLVFVAIALGRMVLLIALRWLAGKQGYSTDRALAAPPSFFEIILPQTTQTGIAFAASTGVLQVSALILARTVDAAEATLYLFGLRILYTVAQFSNVPFYTRLPFLIGKFVDGDRAGLRKDAQRLMLTTLTLQIGGSMIAHFVIEITGRLGLHRLGVMPTENWIAIAAVLSLERLSSMYSQLRSLNNRIDWHKLNVINGLMTLALMAVVLPVLGPTGFSIGLGVPILLFHLPYSTIRLLRLFPETAPLVRITMLFCGIGILLGSGMLWLVP